MRELDGLKGRVRFSYGSFSPRLNPKICDTQLNAKLGPSLPTPLVRETSTGAFDPTNKSRRLRSIGLPRRLED